jgi:hypothetical protein
VEYVMVPVPEELAPKVLDYVRWKGDPVHRGAASAGKAAQRVADPAVAPDADDGPFARVFAALDAPSRTLAALVATASLEQAQITVPDAARRTGLNTREVLGVIVELNNLIIGAGGPAFAVVIKGLGDAADTEFTWDNRVVVMPEPVARPLAELAARTGR